MTKLLYIMQCGDLDHYKFGVSVNPQRRRKQLQTGCPFPIKLLFQLVLDEKIRASALETQIHQHLKRRYHMLGEWFCLEPDHVFRIAKTCLSVGQNKRFI